MKKNRSFKKELIYSFLTVTLVSIILLGAFQIFQLSTLMKENQKYQSETTRFLADYVTTYIENYRRIIETQAADLRLYSQKETIEQIQGQLKHVKDIYPGFINLYLADSTGKAIVFYPDVPDYQKGDRAFDFSDRPYFKELMERKETVISAVFEGKGGTNKQLVTIAAPVLNAKGELESYLLGALDLTALKERIHTQGFGKEGFPVVLDQNNSAVVHPDLDTGKKIISLTGTPIIDFIDEQASGSGASYITKENTEENNYITYEKIEPLGWTVWIEKPASTIANTYTKSILTLAAFLIGTAIVMILVSFYLTGRMEKTIRGLLRYMRAYTEGARKVDRLTIENIHGDGPREMDELYLYFNKMIKEVENNKKNLINLNNELEKRVHERTASLQNKNIELSAVNKLITSVTSEKNISHFIQHCLQEIEPFKEYSIHILFRGLAVSSKEIVKIDPQTYLQENVATNQYHIDRIKIGSKDELLLVVDLKKNAHILASEQEFLQTFASSLAIMLQNKYLFERYRTKHAELEAVLESMSEGLMLLNNDHQVEYVNEFFMNAVSKEGEETPKLTVLNELYQRFIELFHIEQEQLSAFFNNSIDELKLEHKQKSGKKHVYLMHKFLVTHDDGKRGEGLLLRDITKDEEIDTLKDNLISLTSHEFKTPITNIKGSVETLLRSEVEWEPEFQQELLEGVHEDIDRIQHLIDDWMDISKIESGTMYVDRNMIRADHVIEQSLEQIPEELRQHATFTFHNNTKGFLFFYADKRRVQQVLVNLFTNGLRYNDAHLKEIDVTLDKEKDYITISVADNGIGISPDHLERIFNRFYQVDATATRRTGGTGLGLAICKGIMESHEGKIEVSSRLGGGSVFKLYFPIRVGGE